MDSTNRAIGFHYLIRAVIVLSFSILITYLIKNGNINLYIAPRMILLVKLSAIGFYIIGAYQLHAAYRSLRNQASVDCVCDHTPTSSTWKHIAIYSIFVFPLLLGFLLPDTTMGTALAAKKGMNLSASFVADAYNEDFARLAKKIYTDDVIVVKDELFMEILTAVDLFLDRFVGRTAEISGFVYREPDMNQEQFVVGRFAMDCCSADSIPYGVLIEDKNGINYENDTWIKVRGKIEKTVYNGNEIMVFKPESIVSIATPDSPYIYPNYDF